MADPFSRDVFIYRIAERLLENVVGIVRMYPDMLADIFGF